MKFITLIFAILAAVPQAIKWMAFGFAKMNKCSDLPTKICEIKGNDQSEILNKLFADNWFNTTGLYIGLAGLMVMMIISKIFSVIDTRKANEIMDRADKYQGVGRNMEADSGEKPRSDMGHGSYTRGRPRDRHGYVRKAGFDKYGRPID